MCETEASPVGKEERKTGRGARGFADRARSFHINYEIFGFIFAFWEINCFIRLCFYVFAFTKSKLQLCIIVTFLTDTKSLCCVLV